MGSDLWLGAMLGSRLASIGNPSWWRRETRRKVPGPSPGTRPCHTVEGQGSGTAAGAGVGLAKAELAATDQGWQVS